MLRPKMILATLIMAVVVASCTTTLFYDWCLTYNFSATDEDFNIVSGNFVQGTGLVSQNGLLQFNYEYSSFVEIRGVEFSVLKQVEDIGTPFNVTANGTVYGMSTSFTAPFADDFAVVTIENENLGTLGNAINVTIDSGEYDIILSTLTVLGWGENPFPRNDCSALPTETPNPTLEPTPTSSATATEDPLETWTPSPTPTDLPQECALIHITFDEGWENGAGYTASISNGITFNAIGGISSAGNPAPSLVSEDIASLQDGVALTINFDNAINIQNVSWQGRTQAAGGFNVNNRIYSIDGSILHINETDSISGTSWTSVNHDVNVTTNAIVIQWTGISIFRIDNLKFNTCEDIPITPTVTPFPTNTNTPLPTTTPIDPTNTPIGGATWTPSPEPTATLDPTQIQQTATYTSTPMPNPSSTPIPSATMAMSSTPNPEATEGAPFDYGVENEAEWEILASLNGFINTIENFISDLTSFVGDFISYLSALFNNLITMIVDFFNWIIQTFLAILDFLWQLLEIVWLIIQLILGLVNLLVQWLRQIIARLFALFLTFFTVPPTPIPFLPQCASAPLEHDFCAILWAFEWTVFADGTNGAIIIPLFISLLNISIIMLLVRTVLRLVRRGSSVATD